MTIKWYSNNKTYWYEMTDINTHVNFSKLAWYLVYERDDGNEWKMSECFAWMIIPPPHPTPPTITFNPESGAWGLRNPYPFPSITIILMPIPLLPRTPQSAILMNHSQSPLLRSRRNLIATKQLSNFFHYKPSPRSHYPNLKKDCLNHTGKKTRQSWMWD